MTTDHENDIDLVAVEDACPRCGERNIDCLVWVDDDIVHCSNCGMRYQPLVKGGDDATEA